MRLGSLAALPTALALCSCGGLQGTAPSTAHTEPASAPTATTSPELEEPASDVIFLTLPDGARVELRVPADIDVSSKDIRPYSWARLSSGGREIARDFVIERVGSERATALLAAPRLDTYEREDGSLVPFVDGPATGMESLDFLVFRFGTWVVAVYDYPADSEFAGARMTDEERALWAKLFDGHETGDGWLVLEASPPLRLALADWGGPPVSITLEGEDAAVELLGHGWCPPPGGDDVDPADGYVFWCPQGTGRRFGISATGSATVLERLTAGLDLRICSHTATPDTRQCKS